MSESLLSQFTVLVVVLAGPSHEFVYVCGPATIGSTTVVVLQVVTWVRRTSTTSTSLGPGGLVFSSVSGRFARPRPGQCAAYKSEDAV